MELRRKARGGGLDRVVPELGKSEGIPDLEGQIALIFPPFRKERERMGHPAWDEEIKRRVEEIRSGKAVMIPWEEVRARALKKLPHAP